MAKTPELKHYRSVVNGATTTVCATENPDPDVFVEVQPGEPAPAVAEDSTDDTSDDSNPESTADAEAAARATGADKTPNPETPNEKRPARKRTAKANTGTDVPEAETRGGDVNWFAGGDLAGVQQTEETKASAAFGTSSGVVGV